MPHRNQIDHIAVLTGTDERRGRAAPIGLDDRQRQIGTGNDAELQTSVVVGPDFREQQREIGAVCRRTLEDPIDEHAGVAAASMRRLREHRAESGDADRLSVEDAAELIHLGAREYRAGVHERPAPQGGPAPRRRELRRIVAVVRATAQPFVPEVERRRQDLVEDRAFCGDQLESQV